MSMTIQMEISQAQYRAAKRAFHYMAKAVEMVALLPKPAMERLAPRMVQVASELESLIDMVEDSLEAQEDEDIADECRAEDGGRGVH
jgi:hypothetical protein